MKNIYFVVLSFLGFTTAFAQTFDAELSDIVEAERKSAFGTMDFPISPNTANYDVTYQRLELTVDPAVYFISGSITTNFTALENMSTIVFDLTNELTVSTVTQNGNNLAFIQNSDNELVITLQSALNAGGTGTVKVTYSGEPASGEQAFVAGAHGTTPIIWTLSEPFGARDWWPCKQDLNDKISSIDVFITAPSQYTSVSNGVEQSQQVNGTMKTTHFHHNYPIPAYLVAIAVTDYVVYTQQAGTPPNEFPIVNYIYPEFLPTVQPQLAVTLPIMDLYESLFETYPFHTEKYGHAQCGFGGGMEHTTVSFMGGFNRNLIAHELGHQWFGDKVTCGSWNDIWLNEGFATYLSGLVIEHMDGDFQFTNWKASRTIDITSQPGGSVYLSDEEAEDSNRIFSNRLSYNKGAMVLNMLRLKLGDEDFFQGVRDYLADPDLAYGYAVTDNFQEHLETASGIDLDEFFNDWVYMEGYPTYNFTLQNLGAGQAKLTVAQGQSHPSVDFFEMPLPIRFMGAAGETFDVILDNTFNGQEFTVSLPFDVDGFEFDRNHDIICFNSAFLGVKNINLATLMLFPNPAGNQLQVQLPNGIDVQSATFYNTLGQVVMKAGKGTTWNVSGLSSGMHFVTLETNQGILQLKFIKE